MAQAEAEAQEKEKQQVAQRVLDEVTSLRTAIGELDKFMRDESQALVKVLERIEQTIQGIGRPTVQRLAQPQPQAQQTQRPRPASDSSQPPENHVADELSKICSDLSFEEDGKSIVVRANSYLGKPTWFDVNEAVRRMGGRWVSAGKRSYWTIPKA